MKKYQQIYKQIKEQILQEAYPTGSTLPTEMQLTQEFSASRDTIRKALQLLADDGLISKKQGSGSQVLKRDQIHFPVSKLTSYQELVQASGLSSKTNVINLDNIIIDQTLSNLTGFPKGSRVWRVVRQRVVDNIASVLDIDYLHKDLVPKLSREMAEQSIYAYLENQLDLTIAAAAKEITIDQANDRDKILLDIGSDKHVVRIRSKVYLSDQRQFQFTESRHKLDKFTFVDYAYRK